jgi:hypothetical protein
MADDSWNNKNLAHTTTWLLLAIYEELSARFSEARDIKMSALAFYNPTLSSDMLEAEARATAAILDRAYRTKSGATFENGWNVPKAVEAMTTILKDKDKTVCELAAKVDEIYKFTGE